MAEPIPFTPRPAEHVCRCGSAWFTTAVQFDAQLERVVSHSLTRCVPLVRNSRDGVLMRGATIAYAEIDGIPVCILDDGEWCEREMGHDGPHVIAPLISRGFWDRAARSRDG